MADNRDINTPAEDEALDKAEDKGGMPSTESTADKDDEAAAEEGAAVSDADKAAAEEAEADIEDTK